MRGLSDFVPPYITLSNRFRAVVSLLLVLFTVYQNILIADIHVDVIMKVSEFGDCGRLEIYEMLLRHIFFIS